MSARRLVLLLACCIALPAAAGDRLLLAGGEYADDAYYSYLGLIVTGRAGEHGRGILQRYWLDHFGYEYDGGTGRISARAQGAEAAIGYGGSSASGWANVSIGLRFTDTKLSPDDPTAEAHGNQVGVKLQLQGEREFAPGWRVGAIGSVANQQGEYWGRLRLTHGRTPAVSIGGEVLARGNNESQSTAAGLLLILKPADSQWSVGFKAGARRQEGDKSAYGGIELGYAF